MNNNIHKDRDKQSQGIATKAEKAKKRKRAVSGKKQALDY
jgi:hypothetical protein